MNWLIPSLLVAPVVALLAAGLVPASGRADRAVALFGWWARTFTGLALLAAIAAGVQVITVGPMDYSFVEWKSPIPFCLGVHIDAITVIMMTLISFIGLVIVRFSTRYLLGDPRQGHFFRWMAFTLGATLQLVMSTATLGKAGVSGAQTPEVSRSTVPL